MSRRWIVVDQPHRRHRLLGLLAVGATTIGLLAGCASSERPSSDSWGTRWQQRRRALVPSEGALIDGGRSYCDRLVAELRLQLDDLEPTPSESIDPVYESWSSHLRTLAFECPTDPARIRSELAVVGALAAEIETALGEP